MYGTKNPKDEKDGGKKMKKGCSKMSSNFLIPVSIETHTNKAKTDKTAASSKQKKKIIICPFTL